MYLSDTFMKPIRFQFISIIPINNKVFSIFDWFYANQFIIQDEQRKLEPLSSWKQIHNKVGGCQIQILCSIDDQILDNSGTQKLLPIMNDA